jgi:hypothetical protein
MAAPPGGATSPGATAEALASLERRAGWAIALVALSGGLDLVEALHLAADAGGPLESPFAHGLSFAALATFATAATAFLRWLHRAVVCARALVPRAAALRFQPRDAVISFFLPITNLWRPYQKVRRLSEVLDPHTLPEPEPEAEPDLDPVGAYRSSGRRPSAAARWPETAPLRSWWAFWLVSGAFGQFAFRSDAPHAPALTALGDIAFAIAAVFAALVIRSITLRLREIARRRAVPLPPAPFFA